MKPIDIFKFLQTIAEYFKPTCEIKGIEFSQRFATQSEQFRDQNLIIDTQSDALEKIVFNFLSNALKLTSTGGQIELDLKIGKGKIFILIRDTGIPIQESQVNKLFKGYSNIQIPTANGTSITSLGLAFTRELANTIKARVGYESDEEWSSVFWVSLPINYKYFLFHFYQLVFVR